MNTKSLNTRRALSGVAMTLGLCGFSAMPVFADIINNGLSVSSNAKDVEENVKNAMMAFTLSNLLDVTVTIDTFAFNQKETAQREPGNADTDDNIIENRVFYDVLKNCKGKTLQKKGQEGASCTFSMKFDTEDKSEINDGDKSRWTINGVIDGHTPANDFVGANFKSAVITVVDPTPEPSSLVLLATGIVAILAGIRRSIR